MLQNFPESDTQCININFHIHYTTIEDCCLTAACHNCLKQSVFLQPIVHVFFQFHCHYQGCYFFLHHKDVFR